MIDGSLVGTCVEIRDRSRRRREGRSATWPRRQSTSLARAIRSLISTQVWERPRAIAMAAPSASASVPGSAERWARSSGRLSGRTSAWEWEPRSARVSSARTSTARASGRTSGLTCDGSGRVPVRRAEQIRGCQVDIPRDGAAAAPAAEYSVSSVAFPSGDRSRPRGPSDERSRAPRREPNRTRRPNIPPSRGPIQTSRAGGRSLPRNEATNPTPATHVGTRVGLYDGLGVGAYM